MLRIWCFLPKPAQGVIAPTHEGHRAKVIERRCRPFVINGCLSAPMSANEPGVTTPIEGGQFAKYPPSVRQSPTLSSPMTMSVFGCRWCSIGPFERQSRQRTGVSSPINPRGHPANWRSGSECGSEWKCISSARNAIHCVISRSPKRPSLVNRIR